MILSGLGVPIPLISDLPFITNEVPIPEGADVPEGSETGGETGQPATKEKTNWRGIFSIIGLSFIVRAALAFFTRNKLKDINHNIQKLREVMDIIHNKKYNPEF